MEDTRTVSPHTYHRFIDEAGDMSFFSKGGGSILGTKGVSHAFMLGMVKYKQPLEEARSAIEKFTRTVADDPHFNTIPSVRKRISKGGYFLHAKDDPLEIRNKFFEFLRDELAFTLQVIVGCKNTGRFINKHNKQEREFYADLLSYMLHDKASHSKLVLNIADRGSATRIQNLEAAVTKAESLYFARKRPKGQYDVKVNFNVQPYVKEPLLTVADYGLWAVQRVFERGETDFYDIILPKVRYVVDAYDRKHHRESERSYSPRRPLTKQNRIS